MWYVPHPPKMSLLLTLLLCFHAVSIGTSQATPVTDPTEANAVNSMFARWNISAGMSQVKWNLSSDICSGLDLEGGNHNIYNFNPGIICDCRFESGSVCHITKLRVKNLSLTGGFPMELKHLTYLNDLDLAKNNFIGPLPTFIGNFSELEYINIGNNLFSRELPKELGNLKKLKSLFFDINNFTGQLPQELGNLTNLEQMFISSIGVVGGLPSSFAKFKKLTTMFISDNDFGEKLPDFIGNMSSLEKLGINGNSFKGPIPPDFRNLVNMRELRLSDVLDGKSSLSFIENMTHLSALILRNDQLSAAIPSSIGKLVNLKYLDLSFNHLSGQIPESLFNLPSLEKLYLGNNTFTGVLPAQKGNVLDVIDLSYNNLSGGLPSWTSEDNMQLNLVANEFDSNSGISRGLECIQKSTPCYRDDPVYSSFAINCGGNEVSSRDGTIYEADAEELEGASYFVDKNTRWAVSSVGSAFDAPNPPYILSNSFEFPEASDQELFRSARTSPSSLRYYGLALENGNYNVELKFSETTFLYRRSWLSTGKRIFDIYIQGVLVAKDFDIVKEAGESSTATSRNYTASVSKNFLDVHLFWAGKGTCCIPTLGYYGPSISAISVTPDFVPTVSNKLPKKDKAPVPGIVGGTVAAALLFFLILGILLWRRWKHRETSEEGQVLEGLSGEPDRFTFAELKIASDNFSPTSKLGQGGFGPVYKGTLSDGMPVAIKQLSGSSTQGRKQFAAEVSAISAVQHRNLVKLHGCCYEGENRLLVYEYMENKSLDHALFGKSGLHLEWPARFDICLGTARGLAYLHEESSIRIVHRDIKASNILLGANLNAKISDFGLAKLYDDTMTHIVTRVAGTLGYLAPEYAMRGLLTEKVDVYGFGVVLLEILTGRPNAGWNSDGRKVDLLEWSWNLYEKNGGLEMLDPSLSSFNEAEATRMIKIAFLCIQTNPTLRPTMSRVVAMLLGDAEIGTVSSKPAYLIEWDIEDSSTTFSHTNFSST